jgi:hypothetical protein
MRAAGCRLLVEGPGVLLSGIAILHLACAAARGSDQPDQLVTGKKLIVKTDSGDSSRN